MATRQRTRTTRKAGSKTPAGTETTAEASADRGQDSAVLRAAFDPASFDESQNTPSDGADTPKVTFVGEQIVYRDRDARIAEAAYLRAASRGFTPGFELDDWLAAEREIDAVLAADGNRNDR